MFSAQLQEALSSKKAGAPFRGRWSQPSKGPWISVSIIGKYPGRDGKEFGGSFPLDVKHTLKLIKKGHKPWLAWAHKRWDHEPFTIAAFRHPKKSGRRDVLWYWDSSDGFRDTILSRNIIKDQGETELVMSEDLDIDSLLNEAAFDPNAGTHNAFELSLAKARAYAEKVMKDEGKDLDEVLPDFDKNYLALNAKKSVARDVPRGKMPVINPAQISQFDKDLKTGRVDIFKPYAKGAKKPYFPGYRLKSGDGPEWLTLGVKDGDLKDDVIKGKWTKLPASKMKPTQKQIWLSIIVGLAARKGAAGPGSYPTTGTIIASRDGFILDGHHRFGQVMIAGPSTKMKVLVIPLGIDQLLEMGSTYAKAIGNAPKT